MVVVSIVMVNKTGSCRLDVFKTISCGNVVISSINTSVASSYCGDTMVC